jgi:diguanylate cyclase (GGDEF)-like protein/PAS domain S-box-containing protein
MKPRSKLQQQLQLWWPAAVVLSVGCVLSLGLWTVLQERQAQTLKERLEQEAQLFTSSMEQRLYAYAEHLQGMQPALEGQVTSASKLFSSLRITGEAAGRNPGVEAITFTSRMSVEDFAAYRERLLAQVPPEMRVPESHMPQLHGDDSEFFVINDVWPLGATRGFLGLDAQLQPAVKSQIQQALESVKPVMSAPLSLPNLPKHETEILVSVPVRDSLAGGTDALVGMLNISLRMQGLVNHFRSRGMLQNAMLAITDVSDRFPAIHQQVYVSGDWVAGDEASQHTVRELELMGRRWELDFAPGGALLSAVERSFPKLVAFSTLAASLLLAAVVLLLSLQRMRAQMLAAAKHNLLRSRTDRLKALFHQSAIGVAELDMHHQRYVSINTRFADVVGYSQEALEAMSIYDIVHPEDRAMCAQLQNQLAQGQIPHFTAALRMVRSDGGIIWTEVWLSPLLNSEGKLLERQILLLKDATEHRLMQEQLKEREHYSSEMLRYMPVGLVVVGPHGNIEFVNHQFEVVTGWAQSDLSDESTMWRYLCVDAQQHALLLQRLNLGRCQVVPTGVNMPATEYLLRSKGGQELAMEVSGRFLGGRILLSFVDVSQRKAAEAEIRWLGFYDTLTQLPNRRLLLDRLREAVARCMRSNSPKGALLLLDIDNFKSLNETLGHEHGDALLRLVATRLSNCIVGRHTLARQGGDEFAVVLEDLPVDALDAGRSTEQVGRAILEGLRTPFFLGNQDFHVTVSMGAVVFAGPGDSVEELLKRADLALYQAKSAGRDTLQFFDPSMQKAVTARVEMEKDMRLALERHEFDLFFQPQVQEDKVIGAEALLRWKHPTKSFIPPSIFVPAAEESGLILPLGEWVLYAACRQLAHWAQQPHLQALTMSVNVSPRQFYQTNFVEQVQQALAVTGAKPGLLELELTEGMLLTDVEDTINKMVQLKAIGVCFSLDDFGTGYSSLSYLKRLPLDKLKIDQSFVREVVTSANDATIARSIIALGNSLGLQVIAEGVETEAQRAFLADNGCSYWQGYYFSRPKPEAEFAAWAADYAQHAASAQALD